MRIAIYEPYPRVCGPMTWTQHLKAGFIALGHHCDVVTFTRSGKPKIMWGEGQMRNGIHWTSKDIDVTAPFRGSRNTMESYDAVILSDVRTVMHDNDAKKEKAYLQADLPDYISVLKAMERPFTFALHGNNYPPNEVPYAAQLVELPNFSGVAVTHSPTSFILSKEIWPHVGWKESPLPYAMVSHPESTEIPHSGPSASKVVGITGRYITTKGSHVPAVVAAEGYLDHSVKVELHGACSVSLAASATYKTYEALHLGKPYTFEGKRHGVIKPGERVETGGDVIRPYTWDVTCPNGTRVSYLGGYEDGLKVCKRLTTHVDLTAANFSDGMEYSQFEAIDAGCMQVSVESMWSRDFKGEVVPAVNAWPGEMTLINSSYHRHTIEGIGEAINRTLKLTAKERREIANFNRRVLDDKHNPAAIATTFIRALGI